MTLKVRRLNDIEYVLLSELETELEKLGLSEAFDAWFRGQTGIINENNELGVYPCDVRNFLHKVKTGRELFFD